MSVPASIGTGDLGGATVSLVTTAETVAVSSGQVPTPNEVALIYVLAMVAVTTGVGATAIQVRIRRGNAVSGAQVGQTYTEQIGASLPTNCNAAAVDQLVNNYTAQYSVTVQQVGATGNGTVTSATILVITF